MENLHTDHVDEDGIVDDAPHGVETYYRPCMGIANAGQEPERYVRVFIDDDPCNMETRIEFKTLIAAGWTPPSVVNP